MLGGLVNSPYSIIIYGSYAEYLLDHSPVFTIHVSELQDFHLFVSVILIPA